MRKAYHPDGVGIQVKEVLGSGKCVGGGGGGGGMEWMEGRQLGDTGMGASHGELVRLEGGFLLIMRMWVWLSTKGCA